MIGENWLDDILSEVENDVETPRNWIWWSLVTAVSAVAGNNYFVRSFSGKVTYKPNLYVMLLGASGLGKSFPVTLAKLLVTATNSTRVIAGRSSIQAIVKELSTARTRPNGLPPILDSRGFIVNGELSSAIIADVDSLSILTDLYDGAVHPEWTNLLKIEGKSTLKDPYITALFGSSPAGFYETIPQTNIESGYIGRNLIVYEEKRARNLDSFSETNDENNSIDQLNDIIIPKYAKHLESISNNKGRIILNPAAKSFYNSWKSKWRENNPPEKTGFITRVPDHVVKISMCITLARYNNGLIMDEFDITEAVERVTGLMYSNKLATEGKGLDPLAAQTKAVINELIRATDNQLTRKLLMSKCYGVVSDTGTMDKILDSLNEMNWIERERIVAGRASDWLIKLSGDPLINYQKWLNAQRNGQ